MVLQELHKYQDGISTTVGNNSRELNPKTIEIPLSDELPELDRPLAFGSEKNLKLTEHVTFQDRPSVKITQYDSKRLMYQIYMVWVEERNEWVAVKYSKNQMELRETEDSYYSGPYKPDWYCLLMVTNAFKIEKENEMSKKPIGDFLIISPDDLRRASPNYVILENINPEENDGFKMLRIDIPENSLLTLRLTQQSPRSATKTYLSADLDKEIIEFGAVVESDDDFSISQVSLEEMEKRAISSLQVIERHAPDKTKVIDQLKKVIALLVKRSGERFIKILPDSSS